MIPPAWSANRQARMNRTRWARSSKWAGSSRARAYSSAFRLPSPNRTADSTAPPWSVLVDMDHRQRPIVDNLDALANVAGHAQGLDVRDVAGASQAYRDHVIHRELDAHPPAGQAPPAVLSAQLKPLPDGKRAAITAPSGPASLPARLPARLVGLGVSLLPRGYLRLVRPAVLPVSRALTGPIGLRPAGEPARIRAKPLVPPSGFQLPAATRTCHLTPRRVLSGLECHAPAAPPTPGLTALQEDPALAPASLTAQPADLVGRLDANIAGKSQLSDPGHQAAARASCSSTRSPIHRAMYVGTPSTSDSRGTYQSMPISSLARPMGRRDPLWT